MQKGIPLHNNNTMVSLPSKIGRDVGYSIFFVYSYLIVGFVSIAYVKGGQTAARGPHAVL